MTDMGVSGRFAAAEPEDTVTVLGTGIMGSAMARNLVAAGLRTAVWDRSEQVTAPLAAAGALVAASPQEAVSDAQVVITMLPTADAVESVMFTDLIAEALARGAVWAQMGTIGVTATTEFAGPIVAPAFSAIGRKTVWLGAAGQGSRTKLVVNAYMSTLVEGVAEALELASRLGIDPAGLAQVIEGGPLDAPIAAADGDRLPLLEALSRQWRAAVDAGRGREDVSAARLALGSKRKT